ncbi:MAG: hypothetical protein JRD89_01625 [Deltaproteobacteria bacterium]|nr:hypothetical protein [Deltaproteobacteria bacterium]
MNLLDSMLAKNGQTRADFAKNSNLGKVFRKRGVSRTAETDRIARLPSRRWQDDQQALTALGLALRHTFGKAGCDMTLRPPQVAALEELHDLEGLMAPIRVGGGKTLISFLGASILQCKRPLLLVPAKLRDKTHREYKELSKQWLLRPVKVLSYEMLGRERGEAILREYAPDLIIADEAHRLKNRKAAVTRRVSRWFKEHPETHFMGMSGSFMVRGIKDYAHLVAWAMPEGLRPIPQTWGELNDWAEAIDPNIKPEARLQPGVLLQYASDSELEKLAKGEIDSLTVARGAYRRRFTSTPGVVATEEGFEGASLQVYSIDPGMDEKPLAVLKGVRDLWEMPDGWAFMEAAEMWRHARELACGFWYKWDPRPPPDWMLARKEWAAFARDALSNNRRGLDSEMQVARACARGELSGVEYQAWKSIRDSFKPNSVPVWEAESVVNAAADWLNSGDSPGICWVEHTAFGVKLAEKTGLPYFRQGGQANGVAIEDATGPIIASIASNSEGRNLQGWARNLLTSPMAGGSAYEQLLGRTHRDGQEADAVTFGLNLAVIEQWAGVQKALQESVAIEHTTGQAQKLLYADLDILTKAEVEALIDRKDARWLK